MTLLNYLCACTNAKSLQSCSTLCNTVDCSPSGSSVHGSLQARILECVAIFSSRGLSFANGTAAAAAKSLQSCPTLCNPIDGSPPGSPVPGILQARTLEWVAISFSNAWKWKVKVKSLSHVWLLVTPWTAAYQAPPSMGCPRQEYWSGVPLPSKAQRSKNPWAWQEQELQLFPDKVLIKLFFNNIINCWI